MMKLKISTVSYMNFYQNKPNAFLLAFGYVKGLFIFMRMIYFDGDV